jgi:hypothetical protein
MANEIIFQPLTLDIIRKHFISFEHHTQFFPIHYYSNYEGKDPNLDNELKKKKPEDIFTNIFIPNGDAYWKEIQNYFSDNDRYIYFLNNWLLTNTKQKNGEYIILCGTSKVTGDDGYLSYGLQICDGNFLSENCLNVDCYIQKLPVDKYPINNSINKLPKFGYLNDKYNTYIKIYTENEKFESNKYKENKNEYFGYSQIEQYKDIKEYKKNQNISYKNIENYKNYKIYIIFVIIIVIIIFITTSSIIIKKL